MRKSTTAAVIVAATLISSLATSSASALSISPPSTAFTASATGTSWRIWMGTRLLTCSASASGVTPPAGGAAVLSLAAPIISGCWGAGIASPISLKATGSWDVAFAPDGTATVAIPASGLRFTEMGAFCTVTFAPSAASVGYASWTNGSPSYLSVHRPVPVTTTGICPGLGPTGSVALEADFAIPGVTVS